ncbi:MAG: DUF222 domain-containing protein, partial [Nocardioidaceae bacterium]
MTDTQTLPPPVSPAGVLATACADVDRLEGVLWAAKTPAEMLDAKRVLEILRSKVAAVNARLICEIDASNAATTATEEGSGSTPAYLTAIGGGRRGSGKRDLRTARALTGDRGATLEALRGGGISHEQATVIVATIERLPVDTALRAQAEKVLLDHAAAAVDATELEQGGRHVLEVLDPDGTDRREEAALDREERA